RYQCDDAGLESRHRGRHRDQLCRNHPSCTDHPSGSGTRSQQPGCRPKRRHPGLARIELQAGVDQGLPGARVDAVVYIISLPTASISLPTRAFAVHPRFSGVLLCCVLLAGVLRADSVIVNFDPSTPTIGPFPTDFLTTQNSAQKTGLSIHLPMPDCTAQPSACTEV